MRGIAIFSCGDKDTILEYRVGVIENPDSFLNLNPMDPYDQAKIVLAFGLSYAWADYELAYKHSYRLMRSNALTEFDIFYLNYDGYDFSKFMGREFAERLLYGKKRKKKI